MVTTKSGSDTNRVTITNNFAKYYADSAMEYANQAKMYADEAKQTESELTQLIANNSLSAISDNIDNINYLAENLQNIDGLSLEWGKITGDITLQADLKLVLEGKANINELSSVAISGSYTDLTGIPTNVSEFTNDIGYLTEHQDISHLAVKSEIPTKVSALTNDAGYLTSVPEEYITETELATKGYLTEHQDISGKADITDVYTKTEIDTKLGEIETLLEGV